MKETKTPKELIARKLSDQLSADDMQRFEEVFANDSQFRNEFEFSQRIWEESPKSFIFNNIDTEGDWNLLLRKLHPADGYRINRFNRIRIALGISASLAVLLVGGWLAISLMTGKEKFQPQSLTVTGSGSTINEVILPDGSVVTLNVGATLTYGPGFGKTAREVVLQGDAFFNVVHHTDIPFVIFTGNSTITVTGTQFSVRQDDASVEVSVYSGTVILAGADLSGPKVKIAANQSGYSSGFSQPVLEENIPVNTLSWKTGHLLFDETPLDSALIDIARHFRKELSIQTELTEEITAEFQNQPLHEILFELQQVAALEFDTTSALLIVRK